ncbi:endonuclease domain-containing protein [Microbacterium sp. P06]|uniref:endonuclease domain-containing protein n=1 Tax=Microbacterium sp. P06 TaxID=3366949 RepID=UPI0037454657
MQLLEWIDDQGGVVRSRSVTEAGFTDHSVRKALASRAVIRPRAGWLALPSADPLLVAAARAGVVLTCITQAKRLGLWVLASVVGHHVGAPRHSGGVTADRAHVHWGKPLLARHPHALVDPVENVLGFVASCQPFEAALATWESAVRLGLVDLRTMKRLPLVGRARELVKVTTAFSDSGLETFVLVRLAWLRLAIVPQAWLAGHRVDFLIGERLVLQIDGAHHVGRQRAQDIAHDAELMTLGYFVIRVGYLQVIDRWPEVQHRVMLAVAQGLHLARP